MHDNMSYERTGDRGSGRRLLLLRGRRQHFSRAGIGQEGVEASGGDVEAIRRIIITRTS